MRILIIAIVVLPLLISPVTAKHNASKPPHRSLHKKVDSPKLLPTKLPESENIPRISSTAPGNTRTSLGYDLITSNSPGNQMDLTTYDMQSVCRNNRMIDWRGNQMVHMSWVRKRDSAVNDNRETAYNCWDPVECEFSFGTQGGCILNCRSGGDLVDYTGFSGLDVDTEGKAIISNHGIGFHEEELGLMTRVHYDFAAAACFFSPYRARIPDSLSQYGLSPEDIANDNWRFLWPSIEYQVYDGDTVTHVFSQQWIPDQIRSGQVHYFRRFGSDTVGFWDFPSMIIDTIPTISQTVTSSRVSGKVALVWQAPPGAYPGDPESMTRDWSDPGLGASERINDVYYMISSDMGVTWGAKVNVTAYDSTEGGWLGQGDLSCLIDTNDKLHIVWPARQAIPADYGMGEFTNFYGSRLLHWDEFNSIVRTVTDANWDIPEDGCNGGTWNETSIVKPMLSECEGKFYAFYVQFNDIYNGIDDDCADDYYSRDGTANGEIYISVSDNGGLNWDLPQNLTNTYTPGCIAEEFPGSNVCESDQYPAVSRFGMQNNGACFDGAVIVDPSEGAYSGDYYLDLLYVNDKFPGSVMYNDGIWTTNPVKWFRVPCFEPGSNCNLSVWPYQIGSPTWTSSGVQLDTVINLENIGNSDITISNISTIELDDPPGWLEVANHGPITISSAIPNTYDLDVYLNHNGIVTTQPHVLEGYIVFTIDPPCSSIDSLPVRLMVVDSIVEPIYAEIRTDCKRLRFDNCGNMGDRGEKTYNMDYVAFGIDCDTTGDGYGDDNAEIYLYDASPFILRINDQGDTIITSRIFDSYWLSDEAFWPMGNFAIDSTSIPDYRYANTGNFVTHDSLIGLMVEYYAPKHPDSCEFIIQKLTVFNNSPEEIPGVYIGNLMDWDIPSDSGIENGSGFDAVGGTDSRDLIYCYGAEYGPDDIENNDCVLADQRCGGMAFYNGYKTPHYFVSDRYENPAGPWWSHLNSEFVYATGRFEADQLYEKIEPMGPVFESWPTSDPDSTYQDLHMAGVFGQFDLYMEDTLVFINIIASEYDGGLTALQETIDEARAWIDGRSEIFEWPNLIPCCKHMGDSNRNSEINVLDITYLISFLYKGGPVPHCYSEGDTNCDCTVDLLDITRLINYIYKSGPAPCSCEDWLANCAI